MLALGHVIGNIDNVFIALGNDRGIRVGVHITARAVVHLNCGAESLQRGSGGNRSALVQLVLRRSFQCRCGIDLRTLHLNGADVIEPSLFNVENRIAMPFFLPLDGAQLGRRNFRIEVSGVRVDSEHCRPRIIQLLIRNGEIREPAYRVPNGFPSESRSQRVMVEDRIPLEEVVVDLTLCARRNMKREIRIPGHFSIAQLRDNLRVNIPLFGELGAESPCCRRGDRVIYALQPLKFKRILRLAHTQRAVQSIDRRVFRELRSPANGIDHDPVALLILPDRRIGF